MAGCLLREVATIEGLQQDKKVYNAEEVQKILGIGRSKTYIFLDEVYRHKEPFRVIKVGKLFRVHKQSFDDWLDGIS
ncbi:MAG: helix-turn-helix domain-containing protein [Lachnospiraceae bacterium]|nr:helix-turn-helix domain-containing protein [Lachnospiraceae bacterium]